MKVLARAIVGVLVAVAAGVAGLWLWPIDAKPVGALPVGDPSRGAYLARMGGCIACHTDSKNRGKPLAGGTAIDTPFGVFHAPNLTQDRHYGIGAWTLAQFAMALRQGLSPHGEPYYPAFPYTFFAKLTDQDVADLWAAFKTVPAVAEPSKPHELGFPFNVRFALKGWRALFFPADMFVKTAEKSDAWNRGAYIVEAVAHCGACHTPRNLLGARIAGRHLEGASGLPGGGSAPAITASALRAGGWKKADIVQALRIGLTPKGDSLGGAMGEVVLGGTRFLSDGDLNAMATYLLDEPN